MQPRVALVLTMNIFWFYLGASRTVLSPDFTEVIRKSELSGVWVVIHCSVRQVHLIIWVQRAGQHYLV